MTEYDEKLENGERKEAEQISSSSTISFHTGDDADESFADRILREFEERRYGSSGRLNVMSLFSNVKDNGDGADGEMEEHSSELSQHETQMRDHGKSSENEGQSSKYASMEKELLNDFFLQTPDQSETGTDLLASSPKAIRHQHNESKLHGPDLTEEDPGVGDSMSDNDSSSLDHLVQKFERRTRDQTETIRQLQSEIVKMKSEPPTLIDNIPTQETTVEGAVTDHGSANNVTISITDQNDYQDRYLKPTTRQSDDSDANFYFSDKGYDSALNESDEMTLSASFIVSASEIESFASQRRRSSYNGKDTTMSMALLDASPPEAHHKGLDLSFSILQDMRRDDGSLTDQEEEKEQQPPTTSKQKSTNDSNATVARESQHDGVDHSNVSHDTETALALQNWRTNQLHHESSSAISVPPLASSDNDEEESTREKGDKEESDEKHIDLESSSWISFNDMLRRNGFVGITEQDVIDLDSFGDVVAARLKEVLRALEDRSAMLDNATAEKRQAQELVEKYHAKTTELNRELRRHQSAALRHAEDDDRARRKRDISVESATSQLTKQMKKLTEETDSLKQKLIESEAELSFKSEEMSQLRKTLESKNAGEESRNKLAKGIFQQHYRRSPSNSRADEREISLISMYENMRNKHLEQIRHLTDELRQYRDQQMTHSHGLSTQSGGLSLMSSLRQELQSVHEKYKHLQSEYASNIKNYEMKLSQSNKFAKELQVENDKLVADIKTRPSNEQYAKLQQDLESSKDTQAKQHKMLLGSQNPVIEIQSHEWSSGNQKSVKPSEELSRSQHSDRINNVTREHLTEACNIMNVSNVNDLVPTLKKTAIVLATVPKMERFITTVCRVCSRGNMKLDGRDCEITPKTMVPLLENWISSLMESRSRREMEHTLLLVLRDRLNRHTDMPPSLQQYNHRLHKDALIDSVREIVENENKFVRTSHHFKMAEEVMSNGGKNAPQTNGRNSLRTLVSQD